MKNIKKATLVLGISALAVNVAYAQGSNTGLQNVSNGNYGLVIGTQNTTTTGATSSFVAGHGNTVTAPNTIAFGTNNEANGENSFVGGNDAKAAGRNSFAFGAHAESLVEYTVAIGNQARTSAYDTIAIGNGAYANGESTVVIGRTNTVNAENATVVGSNNGTVSSGHGVVIGYNNQILDNSKEQLAFGSNNKTKGQGSVVIGTHAQSTAVDALAIGNNTIADKSNSVAIGTNSVTDDAVGVNGITINGTTHTFAGENPSSVVSFGSKTRAGAGGVTNYNRQLQNVSAGRVTADSTDAINGSQLFAAIDEIGTNATNIANNKSAINTMGQRVATNTADIRTLEATVDNHETRIVNLEHRSMNMVQDINNKVNNLDQRMNKLSASSAALAGLHPLDFNRNDKASYAVSFGHYRNANAIAFGAFYRPNERIMIGAGMSLGSENQYTLNAAFKIGKGSDYLTEAKDKDSRISKLEAMVQKLMAEVEQQKAVK